MSSSKLIAQLRRDEGEVLHAYQDHLGFWTIGIGVLIDKRKGGGITQEESEYLFLNRLREKERVLRNKLPWFVRLDDARQGVLLNMAYQMGVEGLLAFKNTLAAVEACDYKKAAEGMLASKWAQQTPARATRLAKQMETGVWQ